jgi:1A family penicillin-binding protein
MEIKPPVRFWPRLVFWLIIVIIFAVVFVLLLFFFYAPSIKDFETESREETSVIFDRTGGTILYEIYGEENRKALLNEEIPDAIREATIAIEDENFYSHPGVDIFAIARALSVNIDQGGYQQGASTITQQLARSVILSREKTLTRKVKEVLLALKLDLYYSKSEILDRYLNQVPYGSNAYGIQSAAETFFNKNAKDLTLGESTLLAAMPNAPTLYSPHGNRTDLLVNRQKLIIGKLLKEGWITKEEAVAAVGENALQKVAPLKRDIVAPHFVFFVLEELERKYGREFLEQAGLKVYTSLDMDLQRRAEEVIQKEAERNMAYGAGNAALVALDAEKAEVLAMVGSRDYFNKAIDGQVNVALSARQPGSSFKPLVYAKAFEKGYQPETILFDVPISFGLDGSGNEYKPMNYDEGFRGKISMRDALANSLNIPAVQTQYLAGLDQSLNQLEQMGITSLKDRKRFGLSLVLGSGEVSLFEMTQAYSVFSQEGNFSKSEGVMKIVDQQGNTIYSHSPAKKQVLSEQTTRKIASILSDNKARSLVFGTNTPLSFKTPGVAAKTGTTQDFHDGWTLGFTNKVALGVWVGNSNNASLKKGADGVIVAAPLWRSFMDTLLTRYPPTPFTNYIKVESDKPLLTGQMPRGSIYYSEAPKNKKEERSRGKEIAAAGGGSLHSILYYVNKDEPLGEKKPDLTDPMLARWESALRGGATPLAPKSTLTGAEGAPNKRD